MGLKLGASLDSMLKEIWGRGRCKQRLQPRQPLEETFWEGTVDYYYHERLLARESMSSPEAEKSVDRVS